MLGGVICVRSKSWLLPFLRHRHPHPPPSPKPVLNSRFHYHSPAAGLNLSGFHRSSAVWQAILPTDRGRHNPSPSGEGSWNVAWDVRPARWLHRPHTAWLLFGICACLALPPVEFSDSVSETVIGADEKRLNGICASASSANYRIIGVPADGRCLFRAIAHMVCVRNGEEAPDENHQKELADELRAQVVDELLKRRKEIEWFIEGDFDAYVKRIQKPFVWGGEPELLMAAHVLKTTISVFMLESSSNNLLNIATYGKEYEQDNMAPIKVLFHGYGHYDILEDAITTNR